MSTEAFGSFLGAAATAARQGVSANQALKQLREAGLGIQRQTFLRAYKELTEDIRARGTLLGLPLQGRPDSSMISRFTSQRASGFQHIVSIYARLPETGEVQVRRVSVLSETLLTREQAEEMALTTHVTNNYSPELRVFGLALEQVKQFGPNPGE